MSKQESGIRIESSERFKQYPYLITISGPSGAGKTTTGEAVAKILGRPYIKGGELMRQTHRERTGNDIVGPTNRSVEEDMILDSFLAEFMRNASNNNPSIVEARLAALIAKGIIQTKDQYGRVIHIPQTPEIVTVLILVENEKTRFKRVRARVNKREGKKLSLEETESLTREREQENLLSWTAAHPEITEQNIRNPFEPNLMTSDGRKVYDIVIDTENLSRKDTSAELVKKIKEWGERYLRDKPEEQPMKPNLPYQTL